MKKIGLLVMPLMAIPFLASCGCSNRSAASEYFVTFESHDGTHIETQRVKKGGTATEPTTPKRDDDIFKGWFTDDVTFKNAYTFTEAVTSDITLYAKWEVTPPPGISHRFSFHGTDCSINGDPSYHIDLLNDVSAQFKIIPDNGKLFPTQDTEHFKVTGSNVTYDDKTGIINISKMVDDVDIIAKSETEVVVVNYDINFSGKNCKASGGTISTPTYTFQTTRSSEDNNIVLTLSVDSGYSLPKSIEDSILFDNQPGTPTTDYTYDASKSKLTIKKKADVLVTIEAVQTTGTCYVEFDAGENNVIEGTQDRYKYVKVNNGAKWSSLGIDRGIGAQKNNQDFVYWTTDGENYVGENYVINKNITVTPKFRDINTGNFAIHARTDDLTIKSSGILYIDHEPIYYTKDSSLEDIEFKVDDEITLSAGQVCYFHSENSSFFINGLSGFYRIDSTNSAYYHVSGKLNSLTNNENSVASSAYRSLFDVNATGSPESFISAENLILPDITELPEEYFMFMFAGQSQLIVAPKSIGASKIGKKSCYSMFTICTNLVSPTKLKDSLTITGDEALKKMYSLCQKLKVVEGYGNNKFFVCPSDGGFSDAFYQMLPPYSLGPETPTSGKTYYWVY